MATLTHAQTIRSKMALKPGVVFQVLDDGTVSVVVDPSNGSSNVVGTLPISATVSSCKSPAGKAKAPRDSFGIFPGIPNPIRGAAGRLQSTLDALSGRVDGVVAAAPYTPTILVGGGISMAFKGLSGICEQFKETPETEPKGDVQQPAPEIATAPGIFSSGLSALGGMGNVKTSIFGDTIKVVSLVQDLVRLPLRFVAALRPLGSISNTVMDTITNEDVSLTQIFSLIHDEVLVKNINNITKLALAAAIGTAGLMGVCFLGAAVALVVGLSMIPVFWSLLALLMFGLYKSRDLPPQVLSKQDADVQPVPVIPATPPSTTTPTTPVLHLPQPAKKSARSYFL